MANTRDMYKYPIILYIHTTEIANTHPYPTDFLLLIHTNPHITTSLSQTCNRDVIEISQRYNVY